MKNLLIEAVVNNDVEQIKKLLMDGMDPNVYEDSDEVTALHFIAQSATQEALDIVEILLKFGANPHAKTKPDGLTPIDVARLCENDLIFNHLMKFVEIQ